MYNLKHLEILISTIIQKYLFDCYCLTIVTEYSFESSMFNIPFVYLKINNKTNLIYELLQVSEMGCSDYIIQTTQIKNVLTAFDEVNHIATVRRSDRKIIILPTYEKSYDEDLLNILSYKEVSYIANLLLIFKSNYTEGDNCNIYDLVTHQFEGLTGVESPVYLDQWNSCSMKFKNNVNLFPHNMRNMLGRKLKVAAFTYKPYVLLDLDKTFAPLGWDGAEMRVVDEFCRFINCTVDLIRDDEAQWGEIYDNRTGNGVIGNIVEDRADIGITALYSWYHEFTFLDFSFPYIRTAITCIAPVPRLLASWELPLMPFSWWLWLAVLCTYVYASFALIIAQRGSDRAFLTTFGMMITQTQHDPGNSWRIRSITGWMLITGLVLDNAYGGGLASTYTVPKFEKSVDTIQDLIESPLEWGATHDAWIFSLSLSNEPKIINLISKFRVYDADTLRRKSFTRNMAFSIEKLPAGYFAIGDYIVKEAAENFELMLEEFYSEQCVMMARKSSPYTAIFNELVGRLHESGLILAWETQVALKYMDYKVQLEVRLSRSRREVEIEPLHLYHVVGIFILYGIGCALSILLFIGELVLFKNRKKQIKSNPYDVITSHEIN